jgi:hypothetical protein
MLGMTLMMAASSCGSVLGHENDVCVIGPPRGGLLHRRCGSILLSVLAASILKELSGLVRGAARPTPEASQKDIETAEDAPISRLRPIQDTLDYWQEHRSSAVTGSGGSAPG